MFKRFFCGKTFLIVTSIIVLSLLLFLPSCFLLPTFSFGDLTISTEIDKETGAPLNSKNEFTIDVKKIYAAIKVNGVNADDNKRFTILNEDSGQIIFDLTDEYSTETEGPVGGNFYIETNDIEEDQLLLEPGNYIVSFYHDGQLKDSVEFKVKKPEVEILDVFLSSEIDESTLEPLNSVNEFKDSDTVFISIKTNYQLPGDIYSVRWYFGEDEIIDVVDVEITESLYETGSLALWLTSEKFRGPGNYNAEIYLNNSIYGKYDFIVTLDEVVEETIEDYKRIILLFGYPDQFTIIFDESNNNKRIDTWIYFDMDVLFILEDGIYVDSEQYYGGKDQEPEYELVPQDFIYGMTPIEVETVIGDKGTKSIDESTGLDVLTFGGGELICIFNPDNELIIASKQNRLSNET